MGCGRKVAFAGAAPHNVLPERHRPCRVGVGMVMLWRKGILVVLEIFAP